MMKRFAFEIKKKETTKNKNERNFIAQFSHRKKFETIDEKHTATIPTTFITLDMDTVAVFGKDKRGTKKNK